MDRGFTLTEVIIGAALLSFSALVAATITSNQHKAAQVAASQASNVALIDAIRSQLTRASTCLPSLVTAPVGFTGPSEIAVTLGTSGTVRAGADLPAWKVGVQSLSMRNFSPAGTTVGGRTVVLGDVVLSAQSRDADSPFSFRQRVVVRLAMEVQGGAIQSCYASNSVEESIETFAEVCKTLTTSDGVPGTWTGTNCAIPDMSPASTCTYLGGTYDAGRCYPKHGGTIVGTGVDFGNPGGVWYGQACPAGSRLTSGTCLSGSGAPPPLNGMFGGNAFYCEWPPGFESTQYDMWSVCSY